MRIKNDGTWTAWEVSAVLRDSEGRVVAGQPGHAEGLHELQAVGADRRGTTSLALEERVFGSGREGLEFEDWIRHRSPRKVSAFDGCQVAAVTYALNTKAGQTALGYLVRKTVLWLFAAIDVSAGAFQILEVDTGTLEPLPPGVSFVASEWGIAMPGFPVKTRLVTAGIGIKLMKTPRDDLHIQTAFPISLLTPEQQQVELVYAGAGINRQRFAI